eukprot:TRINITY_DN13180_c0_g1_i1.p1 TRINITY_DN13180_c0_g1~~TRINITY_DN13180_c0_g1_i1.p1  ORF type:complete len:493 (-),score=61.97 TRINITY_DN13180_c0_g1_i1:107-1585(-)
MVGRWGKSLSNASTSASSPANAKDTSVGPGAQAPPTANESQSAINKSVVSAAAAAAAAAKETAATKGMKSGPSGAAKLAASPQRSPPGDFAPSTPQRSDGCKTPPTSSWSSRPRGVGSRAGLTGDASPPTISPAMTPPRRQPSARSTGTLPSTEHHFRPSLRARQVRTESDTTANSTPASEVSMGLDTPPRTLSTASSAVVSTPPRARRTRSRSDSKEGPALVSPAGLSRTESGTKSPSSSPLGRSAHAVTVCDANGVCVEAAPYYSSCSSSTASTRASSPSRQENEIGEGVTSRGKPPLSARRRLTPRDAGALVTLHIYDTSWLSSHLAAPFVHVGVELYKTEVSFGEMGVRCFTPGSYDLSRHRGTKPLGHTPLSRMDAAIMLHKLKKLWPGSAYRLIGCNCQTFAMALCKCLKLDDGVIPKQYRYFADEWALPVNSFIPQGLARQLGSRSSGSGSCDISCSGSSNVMDDYEGESVEDMIPLPAGEFIRI